MEQTQTPSEHPKLDALIAGYLEAVERGEAPDRGQNIAWYTPPTITEIGCILDETIARGTFMESGIICSHTPTDPQPATEASLKHGQKVRIED